MKETALNLRGFQYCQFRSKSERFATIARMEEGGDEALEVIRRLGNLGDETRVELRDFDEGDHTEA